MTNRLRRSPSSPRNRLRTTIFSRKSASLWLFGLVLVCCCGLVWRNLGLLNADYKYHHGLMEAMGIAISIPRNETTQVALLQAQLSKQQSTTLALQKELDTAREELQALRKFQQKKIQPEEKGEIKMQDASTAQQPSKDTPGPQTETTKQSDPETPGVLPVPNENCETTWKTPPDFVRDDLKKIWDVTMPSCNETTAGLYQKIYPAGYRNQIMAFAGLVMTSLQDGHNQILLETIRHKDLYGSGRKGAHYELFDVPHWNSFYPKLPRFVHCDPNVMMDYNCTGDDFFYPTHDMPHPYKTFRNQHFMAYLRYSKGKGPFADPFPHPVDVLMKSGALRPHPDLRAIGDGLLKSKNISPRDYMAVHARIEPDMQKHPVCRDLKVLNLTSIVEFLETTWKDPPVKAIFMPINRAIMEKEGVIKNYKKGQEINWIAVDNLIELNRIRDEGLWGGQVQLFEMGVNAMKDTKYSERMWAIGGAVLDFETAVHAKIFVGTEISSFSFDLVSSRFYRGNLENYYYRPDGLHKVTDEASTGPPEFGC